MLKKSFLLCLCFVGLFAQSSVINQDIRALRLKGLKQDFSGKVVHFGQPGSEVVRGVLIDVTESAIVLSTGEKRIEYNHAKVDYIYIDPGFGGKSIALGVALLGAGAGYAVSAITINNDPDRLWAGLFAGLGSGVGFYLGHSTFYKPLRVDISGRLID